MRGPDATVCSHCGRALTHSGHWRHLENLRGVHLIASHTMWVCRRCQWTTALQYHDHCPNCHAATPCFDVDHDADPIDAAQYVSRHYTHAPLPLGGPAHAKAT